MAGEDTYPSVIAMWIRDAVSILLKDCSCMDPKAIVPGAVDKIYITQELFRLFFDSEEVADEAWEQIPSRTAYLQEAAKDSTYQNPRPMRCELRLLTAGGNRAGGREEEFEHEAPSTVIGFSSRGPRGFGLPVAPCPLSPSPDGTSYGVAEQSKDKGPSTFSRSKHEGPNRVYCFSSRGPPGVGIFHFPSGPLPSASGFPSPFVLLPTSSYPSVTSYDAAEQSEDEGSSISNRSEPTFWAKFGLVMDGMQLVDDDGVVFKTSSFLNRLAAKKNKCDGEEET